MNKTANFQLTQWEKTDRIMMEDFNRDNAAIDAALKSNADGAANGAGQLRKLQDRIRHVHRDRQIRQRKSQ